MLVLLSFVVGPEPMALVFNGYELGAMLFAVLIANFLTQDGESNWFEGVQLLSLVRGPRARLLLRLSRRRSRRPLAAGRGGRLALALGASDRAVGDDRRDDADRERRRRSELATGPIVTRSSISSFTPTSAEHDRDRLVEVAEAPHQALDEHEQRPQAEQREDVAHPDEERVAA